jgi:subtilisin family serine protease
MSTAFLQARRVRAAGAIAIASTCIATAITLAPSSHAAAAPQPLHRYVVRVKTPSAMTFVFATATKGGGRMIRRYRSVFPGGAFDLTDKQAAAFRKDKRVAAVEPDRVFRSSVIRTESSAPWGLDRIDERVLPTSTKYRYSTSGDGVTAYVIDTGIRPTHNDFGGRVRLGYDAVGDGQNGVDCNGHGTHVAGTIGGATYGVAKKVALVAVRVLNCQGGGRLSDVIGGIDWAAGDHTSGPAVINMSLGGIASRSLDLAVTRAIGDGISVVVAAGNDGGDACLGSPAEVPGAITVGATTNDDLRADFSNYGSCVDLFAPGVDITSTWLSGNTSTRTLSGTSMASPHVAGAVARYLENHPTASPSKVRNAIVRAATPNEIPNAGPRSPNKLLYVDPAN